MKWFFCWCQDTDFRDDHNWKDLIRVSVALARKNTDLEPHFIYDGEDTEFVQELRESGVNVIFHRLSFTDAILRHSPDDKMAQAIARAAFLRFDIPLVADPSDRFVLYTDADVMFLENPRFQGYAPQFVAAAPQFDRGRRADMNSGVMLLNLGTFRLIHEKLIAFTIENLHLGLDQEVLRAFMGPDYMLLPDIYNWKPYWGVHGEASILHWHGPKPETIDNLLTGKIASTHEAWQPLFERDKAAYGHYLKAQNGFLSAYRQARRARSGEARGALLARGKPTKVLVDAGSAPIPCWQIDLGGLATIQEIQVRFAAGAADEGLANFGLAVSIDGQAWAGLVDHADPGMGLAPSGMVWNGPGTAWARFVRVAASGWNDLAVDGIEVFGRELRPALY